MGDLTFPSPSSLAMGALNDIPPISPLEFIKGKRWERALFTSYALSLNFFESHWIRMALRHSGCREIDVVTDPHGLGMSLSERTSRRVGISYQLHTAAMSGGIFHPKLCCLSGPDGHLVMIGSGNLTFGGYGRNIEVLEVLGGEADYALIRSLSGYFKALLGRQDLMGNTERWAMKWHDWARGFPLSPAPSEMPTASILHSVEEPVGVQLAREAAKHGGVTEFRVLSPFFDADARGIELFCSLAKIPKVVIGLMEGNETECSYPFDRTINGVEVCAAAVKCPDPRQGPLHAKWFELSCVDGTRLILTGSVNATRQSFMTTGNVELGVLRRQAADDPPFVEWTSVPMPEFSQPSRFDFEGFGMRLLLDAKIDLHGERLSGQMHGQADVAGVWQANLSCSDGLFQAFELSVSNDGSFEFRNIAFASFGKGGGVQLEMSKGTIRTRCWVTMSDLLSMGRSRFISVDSYQRILSGNFDGDDVAELIHYLAQSVSRHLPAFTVAAKTKEKSGEEKQAAVDDRPFDLPVEFDEGDAVGVAEPGFEDRGRSQDRIKSYIRNLRRNFYRKRLDSVAAPSGNDGGGFMGDDDEEDPTAIDTAVSKQAADSLDKMEGELMGFLDQLATEFDRLRREKSKALRKGLPFSEGDEAGLIASQRNLAGLFCMWFEPLSLTTQVRSLPPDEIWPRYEQWMYCAYPLVPKIRNNLGADQGSIPNLDSYFLGTILTKAARLMSLQQDNPDDSLTRLGLSRLHGQLQVYFNGELDRMISETASDEGEFLFSTPLLPSFEMEFDRNELIRRVREVPSMREQVEQLNAMLRSKDSAAVACATIPILNTRAGRKLKLDLKTSRIAEITVGQSGQETCAHCHIRPPDHVLRDLQDEGFSHCGNCGRFIATPD
jgi:hypothetical protein